MKGRYNMNADKYPSFYAQYGHKPVAGIDYNQDESLCQDDYEYLTGTGRYADDGCRVDDDQPGETNEEKRASDAWLDYNTR
jgi:hypothetical protein